MAEAGRLLPEIEAWQSAPVSLADLDSPGAQNRFYEGVGQVLQALLQGEKPGVLFWDDVHWLDSASLEIVVVSAATVAKTAVSHSSLLAQ